MEKLSSKLQETIRSRPTNTILKSEKKVIYNSYKKIVKDSGMSIPESFDGRKVWSKFLTPPLNQGLCGSCWAFATCGALSDRFNIQSLGQMYVQLSPTKMILCDWGGEEIQIINSVDTTGLKKKLEEANVQGIQNSSCFGNTLADAGRYLFQVGTTTLACVPYDEDLSNQRQYQKLGSFTSPIELPLCTTVTGLLTDMCSDVTRDLETGQEIGTPSRFFKCIHDYGIYGTPEDGTSKSNNGSPRQLEIEIYKWGPIVTGIDIYPDFYTFNAKNTIYSWNKKGPKVGGHAIEIVGWGRSHDNVEYWIVKNSWGTEWGDQGYFRIRKGVNECGVEENCMALQPDFFYGEDYTKIQKVPMEVARSKSETDHEKKRRDLSYISNIGGGISLNTGFSRRSITKHPWVDINRPVPLNNLPDWDTFVAGALDFSSSKSNDNSNDNSNDTKCNGWLLVLVFCVILLIIIFLFIHFFHRYKE